MDFKTYHPLALRTAKLFPSARQNLQHSALGLMTESGEFATEVKRVAIYGKVMTEEMRLHAIEEIGDTLWYVPLGLMALGADELPMATPEQLGSLPHDLVGATVFLGAMSGAVAASLLVPMLREEDKSDLLEVFGGIVAVVDLVIAPALGTTGDAIRAQNIEKLRKRFPDAYTDAAAEARADKGGLGPTES